MAPLTCQVEGCGELRVRHGKPQCHEHYNEYQRAWKATRGLSYNKHLMLKRLYGLTIMEYDQMVAEQGGVCAICRLPEKQVHKGSGHLQNLTVDHDHETGAVRGLLCVLCNTMIGRSVDRPAVLRAAADYLDNAAIRAGSNVRKDC